MVRSVFHLPLRALEGFLSSLIVILELAIPVPSYTQICRRAKTLESSVHHLSRKRPTDIVFDSSGLKVYGEGEWKVKQHGKSKRRSWRKISLAIDPDSQEIILEAVTDQYQHDITVAKEFISSLPKSVEKAYGDGIFDANSFYQELHEHGVTNGDKMTHPSG